MINVAVLKKTIMETFDALKKEIPNFSRVTFEATDYYRKGEVRGFYHIGCECKRYDNLEDLAILLSDIKNTRTENEILFRKFSGKQSILKRGEHG